MNIDFRNIESIPQLIKDFLDDRIEMANTKKFSLDNFATQIEEKKQVYKQETREKLVSVLETQNQNLTFKQQQYLKLLKDNNTFTVTTGHQLNLFTGPVFFIYKILQTIKTAEFLKDNFPGYNVVPIFWMATEDHDFDEIDHFKTENNFYEIKAKAGTAVGRLTIEDTAFIADFEKEFKDHVYGTELIRLVKDAYKLGESLSTATRKIVNYLFGDYGLLVLDGDDASLKTEMQTVFKEELLSEQLFTTTSKQRTWLKENYGKVQVNPREINLFYLKETRNRIEKVNDQYQILDTDLVFSEAEILNELENFPERFSPNAVLRPAYQEVILPNLAYIGGNAEIMYWLELVDYFKAINVPFPILVPRNSMLFLNQKTISKMQRQGLEASDFFKNFAALINNQLLDNHPIKNKIAESRALLTSSFIELKKQASLTDITFKNLVDAEETRQLKSFAKMEKRLLRAEKKKQAEKVMLLEGLFLNVHPNGIWQERQYNFSVYYADQGKTWLETCYKSMNVEKSEMIISHLI